MLIDSRELYFFLDIVYFPLVQRIQERSCHVLFLENEVTDDSVKVNRETIMNYPREVLKGTPWRALGTS